jgi:hypothetical protein
VELREKGEQTDHFQLKRMEGEKKEKVNTAQTLI